MHISPNMRFTLSIWIYEILESFKISLGCVVPEKPQNLTFWNLGYRYSIQLVLVTGF